VPQPAHHALHRIGPDDGVVAKIAMTSLNREATAAHASLPTIVAQRRPIGFLRRGRVLQAAC
jgi:hypothetical protein